MTPNASHGRMIYYIATSMLATFTGGIMTADFSDWRSSSLFVAAILGAGLTAARGYVDKSPTEVAVPPPDLSKLPPLR